MTNLEQELAEAREALKVDRKVWGALYRTVLLAEEKMEKSLDEVLQLEERIAVQNKGDA